jgi:hypothetical protein
LRADNQKRWWFVPTRDRGNKPPGGNNTDVVTNESAVPAAAAHV